MLNQIDTAASTTSPLPSRHAVQTAGSETVAGAGWPSDKTGLHAASLTQKATVAQMTIDPSIKAPRILLKPFGIEMWGGSPVSIADPLAEQQMSTTPSVSSDETTLSNPIDRVGNLDEPAHGSAALNRQNPGPMETD